MAGVYYVDFLLERYDRNILSELSLYGPYCYCTSTIGIFGHDPITRILCYAWGILGDLPTIARKSIIIALQVRTSFGDSGGTTHSRIDHARARGVHITLDLFMHRAISFEETSNMDTPFCVRCHRD